MTDVDRELYQKVSAWVDAKRDDIVRDISDLVKIRSVSDASSEVKPYGQGCRDAMDRMLELCRGYGMKTENYGYHVGTAWFQEGERTIGLWGHLDVVEEGSGWQYPPYEALEREGYLIGRGADDNKGPAVASLYTLRCLWELGLRPLRAPKMFFGCNEEQGMADLDYYLERFPCPELSLVVDSGYPVAYGQAGSLTLRLDSKEEVPENMLSFQGGEAPNMIPGEAFAAVRTKKPPQSRNRPGIRQEYSDGILKVWAKGISGHPAFPEGSLNALRLLTGFLLDEGSLMGKGLGMIAFLHRINRDLKGGGLGISVEYGVPEELICAGTKAEIRDGKLSIYVNIRYPSVQKEPWVPDAIKKEELLARMEMTAGTNGFSLLVMNEIDPKLYFPKDHPAVSVLEKVFREAAGIEKEAFILGGSCYAGKLTNALGFGPGLPAQPPQGMFPPGHGRAHGPDEALQIENLLTTVKINCMTLLALDSIA